MSKKTKVLSVFTLALINVAAVSNVKNWPFMAEFGFSSLFYLILTAIAFFCPVSLVSAELATSFPEKGGVYLWVKEAFGKKWGFLAVWLQWAENIVWYPAVLSFAASTIAYIFAPELANHVVFTVCVVLILFWGSTIANLFGMKTSGWISNIGAYCGTFIPGLIIIILGIFWIREGSPIQIPTTWDALIPDFSFSTMVFFTGIMLAFGGMEMSAVHALDVQNPRRNYPRAIFLSALLILVPTLLGTLSIAFVVPQDQISLTAGTMQAFTIFLDRYHLSWFIPFIAASMAVGLFGTVSTWIIGPTKALLAASEDGDLPKFFNKTNKSGAPINLMITQAVIGSILSLLFLLMPNVSSGFWILTVLTAQLYLIMYIMMFVAALYLRYKRPNLKRSYKVGGGKVGIWIASGVGILSSTFALLIGYIPPDQIEVGSPTFYTNFLIAGTVVGVVIPFMILRFKKRSWAK